MQNQALIKLAYQGLRRNGYTPRGAVHFIKCARAHYAHAQFAERCRAWAAFKPQPDAQQCLVQQAAARWHRWHALPESAVYTARELWYMAYTRERDVRYLDTAASLQPE